MKKYIACICILLQFSASVIKAQPSADSLIYKLNEYLTSANAFHKFNGVALIAKQGTVLLHKAYGYKDVSKELPNDTSSLFRICSITKEFTATAILKLQEEGKLSVQDKLSKYFPEFKYANEITLANLLNHTSGIYNYTNDIDESDSAIVCRPVNKQLILDIIFNHPPGFKPGTRFSYSNSGYYLLGLIIAKVTGKSYEQTVRDIIFTPLQMTHSLFDFTHSSDTDMVTGYKILTAKENTIATGWRWDSTVTYAAGGIWSTTGDMYAWAQAIAEKEIISPDSWKLAFTPRLNNYGFGWWIDTSFGKKYIMHSGGLPGFVSYFCYYPGEGVTIILLSNAGNLSDGLTSLNTNLSAILFSKPYELVHNQTEMYLPDSVLTKYVGKYDFDKKHHVYITLDNHVLQMEAPEGGLPKSPLFPADSNHFYLKIIDAKIEFTADASGNVTQLISHYKGKDESCKKVK